MVYEGHIKNGVAVFDQPTSLPEGMKVQILPIGEISKKSLADRFRNVIGVASDLPEDLAEKHDEYLHDRDDK